MVNRTRLADLEGILELLYEKLGEFERELIINANTPAKFELKQRIKREILPDIQLRTYVLTHREDEEALRGCLRSLISYIKAP
jgi:hypothetical protein